MITMNCKVLPLDMSARPLSRTTVAVAAMIALVFLVSFFMFLSVESTKEMSSLANGRRTEHRKG